MSAKKSQPPRKSSSPAITKQGPVRNNTIEVELSWFEPEEATPPGSKRKSVRPPPVRRETIDVKLEWLEEVIQAARRESTTKMQAVEAEAKPKKKRQPWEPPTLPPPPPTAVKSRRAVPPPLPREEPEEAPKRRSTRPPKR